MRWTNNPEPWELEADFTERLERQAKVALEECPICPYCGEYVDTKGITLNPPYYVEDTDEYFHYDCYMSWLVKHPDRCIELAVEWIDEHMTHRGG